MAETPSLEEAKETLRALGIDPDEVHVPLRSMGERQSIIETPEINLGTINAKLDKLQEAIDRIAEKLDTEGPA
jgi:hypothetical protein